MIILSRAYGVIFLVLALGIFGSGLYALTTTRNPTWALLIILAALPGGIGLAMLTDPNQAPPPNRARAVDPRTPEERRARALLESLLTPEQTEEFRTQGRVTIDTFRRRVVVYAASSLVYVYPRFGAPYRKCLVSDGYCPKDDRLIALILYYRAGLNPPIY